MVGFESRFETRHSRRRSCRRFWNRICVALLLLLPLVLIMLVVGEEMVINVVVAIVIVRIFGGFVLACVVALAIVICGLVVVCLVGERLSLFMLLFVFLRSFRSSWYYGFIDVVVVLVVEVACLTRFVCLSLLLNCLLPLLPLACLLLASRLCRIPVSCDARSQEGLQNVYWFRSRFGSSCRGLARICSTSIGRSDYGFDDDSNKKPRCRVGLSVRYWRCFHSAESKQRVDEKIYGCHRNVN